MGKPARGAPRGRVGSTFLLVVGLLAMAACVVIDSEPRASFGYSPDPCYCGASVLFDASSSHSGSGEISSYAWRFGDGSTGRGRTVEHVFSSPGQYSVELTVVTEGGEQAFASRLVTILHGLVVPSAYPTIQSAIDAALDGEVVVVLPGTYYVSLAVRAKRITIRSTDPQDSGVVSATVLRPKPNSGRPVAAFGEYTTAMLDGFTITGMIGCPECATGAIYIRESSPIIRRNRIVDNREGGIVAIESGARFLDNVFEDNVCSIRSISGGAVHIYGCRRAPTIAGNVFQGNIARSGGAIYVAASCEDLAAGDAAPVSITNNVFGGNTATDFGGGAVFVEFGGNLGLDTPDSNTYIGNEPDDVFYVVPPT